MKNEEKGENKKKDKGNDRRMSPKIQNQEPGIRIHESPLPTLIVTFVPQVRRLPVVLLAKGRPLFGSNESRRIHNAPIADNQTIFRTRLRQGEIRVLDRWQCNDGEG